MKLSQAIKLWEAVCPHIRDTSKFHFGTFMSTARAVGIKVDEDTKPYRFGSRLRESSNGTDSKR
jgi:hypothetical protein